MALNVQVTSPESELFNSEASFVLAKSVEGDLGLLPGHIPILVKLAAGEITLRGPGDEETKLQVSGGFMSVKDDKVIVLIEEATAPTT